MRVLSLEQMFVVTMSLIINRYIFTAKMSRYQNRSTLYVHVHVSNTSRQRHAVLHVNTSCTLVLLIKKIEA